MKNGRNTIRERRLVVKFLTFASKMCTLDECMILQNGIQYKSRQTSLDEGGEEGTSIKLTITKEHLTACPNCGMGMWNPKVICHLLCTLRLILVLGYFICRTQKIDMIHSPELP